MARQIVQDSAICLRRSDFSETSQTVTLLTEATGKVSALAKGSRRPKNRSFAGAVELLTAGAVVLRVPADEGMALLTEWQLTETFAGLRNDLPGLYGAYYLAELTDRLTELHDPHPTLYAALHRALGSLAAGRPRASVLLAYEYYLLRVLGMLPNLRACVCGRTIPAGRTAAFSPQAGALYCGTCSRPDGPLLEIAPAARRAFESLRRGPVLAAAERIPPAQAAVMSLPLRQYVTATLGRPLRLYRYLAETAV